MSLIPITDEKLEDYLSVWDGLIERGYKSELQIEIKMDFHPPMWEPLYTLKYGEEIRKISYEQAIKVKDYFMKWQGGHP